MPQEVVPGCTGRCQMVDTYKTINRALTKQNSDYKEALAHKNRENTELQQLVMDLRTELAELKKNDPINIRDTIDVISLATEACASISQIVQNVGEKLAIVNNRVLKTVQGSSTNASLSRTPLQSKTPTNVSRIRPIIRTPNGLMQTVTISLPRIDHSMLFSNTDRFANSTTISENEHSSASSTRETVHSEEHQSNVRETEPTEVSLDTTRDTTENAPSMLSRLPRHTSEMPYLEQEATEIESFPDPELIRAETNEDLFYDDGLSIIHEVTEIDNTVNPSLMHGSDVEQSTRGTETALHPTRASCSANKENALNRSRPSFFSQATCSTPYNSNGHERLPNMKIAKIVLQQLNMDEIKDSQNQQTRSRNDSESSDQSTDSRQVTTRKRAGRKRKDSEMSTNTIDSDDESSRSSGRPKRRATPTSFKEPSLSQKMRRPT